MEPTAVERGGRVADVVMAAALGVGILGMVVLGVGELASWESPWILVAGVGMVGVGLILGFLFGFLVARRDGKSVARAVWQGLTTLVGWVVVLVTFG